MARSTLKALHALQRRHGLARVDSVDQATLDLLLDIEQNIVIVINQNAGPTGTPTPPPIDPGHGVASGKLVDGDGAAIAATKVVLIELRVRSRTQLGEATTDENGQYRIRYRRDGAPNLEAQAHDATGKVIATSATVFRAAATVEIDFSTGPGGVVKSPSLFTSLTNSTTAQLGDTPLADLKENKESHELMFLASAIGASFANVADLYIAVVLAAKNSLRPDTLFGLFKQGIPPSLGPALNNLPDAGIDDTFTAQVMSGVLAHTRATLGQALDSALAANVLPQSYAEFESAELSRLDAMRVTNFGGIPYIRGKTSLNDLLAAGTMSDAARTAFVQAFADNAGRLGPTWTALRRQDAVGGGYHRAQQHAVGGRAFERQHAARQGHAGADHGRFAGERAEPCFPGPERLGGADHGG